MLYANRSRPGGFDPPEYASLAHYFDSVVDMLTKIADGSHPVCEVTEGRLRWS
ncbi:hypothetical protein AB0Q95_12975 [Streptomyces sp. NPDC059900]|uniref:hypothetical protein n=1 Tax=Streptomyces sp. NPDC059900 TaxID=3155816 RepID=UPI00342A2BAF